MVMRFGKGKVGLLAALSLVVLAGCDPSPAEADKGAASPPDRAAHTFSAKLEGCAGVAEGFGRKWTGKPYGKLEEMMAQWTILHVSTVRVIRPGTMVTEDYVPDRLNITLDENDVVTKFHCG